MRTYADYMNEARQSEICRGIGPDELDALTWRSIIDVCSENDLAFMIGEGRIQLEASYSTGTVAVSGTGVTLSDGTWSTSWANRRIRIQGRTEYYDVTIGSTTSGTLATAWQGDATSGLTYVMFRDVYSVPSDCDFTKESLLWDVTNNRRIDFVDYSEFREKKRAQLGSTGDPTEAARLGVNASGVPQIEFGPLAPSSARTLMLDYYRSPVKPSLITSPLSPTWPSPFEDVVWLRTIWKYAERRGHPRRFEAEQAYKRRIFSMRAEFEGGNEMRRRLRVSNDRNVGSGMTVGARWTGA